LSPASGLGVISAGSSDNAIFPAQVATIGSRSFTYYNFLATAPATVQVYTYPVTATTFQDGCAVPDNLPDLSNKVVVIPIGNCSDTDKARNAYYAGALYVLIVNYPDSPPVYSNFPFNVYGYVSSDDGAYLLSQIGKDVTFGFNPIVVPNTFSGNTTSFFSEIGPSNDLFLGTTILTPGTNIISTVPSTYSNWSITDGTSWSSAFAAGGAALYLAANGNASPATVKGAFEFSGRVLPVSRTDSSLETVAAQGAGELQLFDAINPGTTVFPGELLLNDTAYFASVQYITVTNNGNSKTSYKVSNLAAGTALAYPSGNNQSNDQPVPQVSNAASVSFYPSSFTLKKGDKQIVIMNFKAPTGLDPKQFPIYSGWIQVIGGSTPVQVPYLGVAAKMKEMAVLDSSTYAFDYSIPTILDGQNNVQDGTQTYTFQNGDFPTALYR
jgi:hypothetical protein